LGLLLLLASGGARASAPCAAGAERVVGYAVGSDRYAVREDPSPSSSPRFVVRRLSTGEPAARVTCASAARCDLTDALGLSGCSYSVLPAARATHGLLLSRVGEGGTDWVLEQEGRPGPVKLLDVRGAGELEIRTVRIVGQRALVVVRQTEPDLCPSTIERVLELDESELRPGRARVERAHSVVDLDEWGPTDLPVRVVPPFRAMRPKVVVRAALTAAAAGLPHLAACWIQHNADLMSDRARDSLHRDLAGDRTLAPLAELAARKPPVTSSRVHHHRHHHHQHHGR
jgi:hypothetical protein